MSPLQWMAAATLLLLAGCGDDPEGGPPEIRYGLEECGYCRMIISVEKFAAAIVHAAGTATRFDDVGCLVDYLRQQPIVPAGRARGAQKERLWVHDHAAGAWVAAEPASFVRDPRTPTPMGSGLVAFASRSAANAFAAERGVAVETLGQVVATTTE